MGDSEVAVKGPGGWGVRLQGRDTIIIILLAAALASLLWINYEGFRTIVAGQAVIVKQHEASIEELQTMTYLLALPEGQRPRLAMPRSLRERLDGRNY